MYHLIDREVAHLPEGERLLLLAMRDWTFALRRQRCPVDAVTLRFLSHGLVGGLEPFVTVMTLIARHGARRSCLGCPCVARVLEDEAILLAALCPDGEREARRGAHLVEPYAADRFALALGDLDAAVMLAGLA